MNTSKLLLSNRLSGRMFPILVLYDSRYHRSSEVDKGYFTDHFLFTTILEVYMMTRASLQCLGMGTAYW